VEVGGGVAGVVRAGGGEAVVPWRAVPCVGAGRVTVTGLGLRVEPHAARAVASSARLAQEVWFRFIA
jgi:hypothetical protein